MRQAPFARGWFVGDLRRQPRVLRLDGVLIYDPELAALVDHGHPLPAGSPMEREIRACAVHACERLARWLAVAPRILDNRLSEPRPGATLHRAAGAPDAHCLILICRPRL